MNSTPFDKFINKEPKGAKKKEAIRQEKRKTKAAAQALGEEMRKQKWEKKRGIISEKDPAIETPDSRFKGQRAPRDSNSREERAPNTREGKFESNNAAKSARFGAGNRPTTSRPITSRSSLRPVTPAKSEPSNTDPDSNTITPSTSNSDAPVFMPLNKFVAHAGICGRREAAELVKQGLVTVNGDKIFEPGFKVQGNEDIKVKGKKIFTQCNLVYILLNKPKDYITTAKDPEGRKTVLDLVKGATKERVYSVGRLDRNTTGVLLLTNDGELAQKLTHPSYQIKKIYEVRVDKPVTKKDYDTILEGITLEDGFVKADSLAYADDKDKSVLGIEIHSGRNRIVRRIFEHLGYDVKNLDRVMFANLTKKNVERGTWRMLMEKEVRLLKFMNQSFLKKQPKD
jgi:23S rRNA pseudouridine2605 synthase